MSNHLVVLTVLITLSVLWGSSFLAIKEVISSMPPLFAFGIRFAISGIALLIVFYFHEPKNKRHESIDKRHWRDGLLDSVFIILGGQGLLVWGAQYLSSGMTALLNSTIPLWIALLGALILKQRLTRNTILGLVAGFAGLIILVNPFSANSALNPLGVVSLTLSSIFWAIGSIYSARSSSNLPVSILASAGILMLLGGILLLCTSFIVKEFENHLITISNLPNTIIAFMYLIFLCTVVGYAEFFWLLKVEFPAIANSFAYIVPIVAVLLGWVIFNERITIQTVIASCIIIAGVAVMIRGRGTKPISPVAKKPR
jgi:drug/metabolite transporter (DMT)-like permease